MKNNPRIAIIGGGPGGLTAAVILHKAGWDVRVFEADASALARSQGGTLDVHAETGQLALQRAGLLEEFQNLARHEDQETRSIDWQSGLLLPDGPWEDSDSDRPEIDRGVLRDLLLGALPKQSVAWNRSLLNIERYADGRFALNFREGRASEADVVIGADGAWSAVRRYLTPVDPTYTGVTFMEGWIDTPTRKQAELVGNGTLFSFGRSQVLVAQKNGKGRICVYAAVKQTKDLLTEQMQGSGANAVVERDFENWAPQLRELLSACPEFVPRPIHHLPIGFQWPQQDSITLIGDAAHLMPPLGVGVNLAMLDASDLAMAITSCATLQESIKDSEGKIRERGAQLTSQTVTAFAEWFTP